MGTGFSAPSQAAVLDLLLPDVVLRFRTAFTTTSATFEGGNGVVRGSRAAFTIATAAATVTGSAASVDNFGKCLKKVKVAV